MFFLCLGTTGILEGCASPKLKRSKKKKKKERLKKSEEPLDKSDQELTLATCLGG